MIHHSIFPRSLAGRSMLLISATCLAPFKPAFAQESVALPQIDVDSPVDGSSLPSVSATTLSRTEVRARQSRTSDTARILQSLPGVSGNSGGGFSTMPVLRGLIEQRLNILVDGFVIDPACPNDMNPPLSYTDPQTVDAITVITGVTPVSMGGDSIGGAITVETAPPVFATSGNTLFKGEASSFFRSNDDAFGGAVTLTAASDRFSLTYNGSYTQAGNYRGGGNLGVVRSTEYAKTDHALALAMQTAAGLLELKGGYHFSPYEGFANQYMDMTSNRSWFLNAHYKTAFDWGDLDVRAQYRDTDHAMNFLEDKGGTADGGMPMNTKVHTASYAIKAEILASSKDKIRVGNEFHHLWLDDYWPPVAGSMMMGPNTFVNINAGKRDRLGTFLEWERRWNDAVTTLAGVRHDMVWMNTGDVQPYATNMMNMADAAAAASFNAIGHARSDSNWSGTALVRYTPAQAVKLELGYAHKSRSPNLYERYSWGRGSMASRMIGWSGDGNGYVGNIDLKPERADTVSASFTWTGAGEKPVTVTIAPYYTHVDDYIDVVKLANFTDMMGMPTGFVQLRFANQKAEFYGVDVSAAAPLWDSAGAGRGKLTAAASWVHGGNLTDGRPLYHQMPFNLKVALEHRLGGLESAVDLEWVTEKNRVDTIRNEPRSGSYALLNLRTAYVWSRFRVSLDVENLLDKGYSLPLGGMSLGDLKATGFARPVPGRGRSVNLGLGVTF